MFFNVRIAVSMVTYLCTAPPDLQDNSCFQGNTFMYCITYVFEYNVSRATDTRVYCKQL